MHHTVFSVRENTYYYRFIFEEAIYPRKNGQARTIQDIVEEYAKILERYIAEYPEQWYMFEKCWIDER